MNKHGEKQSAEKERKKKNAMTEYCILMETAGKKIYTHFIPQLSSNINRTR